MEEHASISCCTLYFWTYSKSKLVTDVLYVCDCTVGASHLIPVQPATSAPVPASKEFSIDTTAINDTSKTSTTQRPTAKPNLTVTKTSQRITTFSTAARDQTTLSSPPSGPGKRLYMTILADANTRRTLSYLKCLITGYENMHVNANLS